MPDAPALDIGTAGENTPRIGGILALPGQTDVEAQAKILALGWNLPENVKSVGGRLTQLQIGGANLMRERGRHSTGTQGQNENDQAPHGSASFVFSGGRSMMTS